MRILNYGSLNLDFNYYLEHIVMPGETVSFQQLEICPDGKGLNQSIALARAGAEVWHAGMIGGDGQNSIILYGGANQKNFRKFVDE